ncbi:unnamed protein product [Euphydryas editha]|uniref:CLIP domain-containing serine protease n=1 Tax=Euphydryas editha TaxID=104508 RepID=A0AAU9U8G0_EUPED|nr:unnamed protein product [Euphydryas editha]
MMFMCLLCFVIAFVPIESSYHGESCFAGDSPGTCKLLSNCPSLVREIRRAGNPWPSYMTKKLRNLGCGFEDDEPLVCCNHYTRTDVDAEETKNYNDSPYSKNPWLNTGNHDDDKNGNVNINSNRKLPDIRYHRNLNLLPSQCGPVEGERIFGGNRTRLFEMPWMVLLTYDSARGTKLSCGGTLITKWYVLTAAHCVSFLGSSLKLKGVILGEWDVRKDPDCERIEGELFCAPPIRNVQIDNIIAHPGYTPQVLADDIALIRLAEPADFSLDTMKPICLPTTPELQSEKLEGLQGVVAGWGATEDGLQSSVLLSVELPIITNKECQTIYNGSPQIFDSQLCAGGEPDKDSCGGDSGGPLMYPGRTTAGVRYVQRGVVSYGSKRCGVGGYPGVYTRVANYMDWILDHIYA